MSEGRHSAYFYGVQSSNAHCLLWFKNTFPEMKLVCGAWENFLSHESDLLPRQCLCTKGLHRGETLCSHFKQQLGIQT